MRLGFHYHIPALEKNGQIFMPGYLGRFIDGLANECEELTCFMHSPLGAEIDKMDYAIQPKNVKLVSIGLHNSVPERMLAIPKVKKIIQEHLSCLDAMLIRGPSPLLPAVARACACLPTSLLLVGDYLAGIDDLPQPGWRKELIRVWSKWNAYQQLLIAKKSLTFVNSHLLFEQLCSKVDHLVETRTTTLTEDDFYDREDTCQQTPIRLLYTGRMDRSKGLMDIVEALNILRSQGIDAVLDLVGMQEPGDPILQELEQRAMKWGIQDKVQYHGYKPIGTELFSFYKNADIYIIASQSSEGFPRTIWEAMAHSLPVVATKVGSIPDFLNNEALLTEPRNPELLAGGIRKIINDKEGRQAYIQNGRQLARKNTLQKRASELLNNINNWVLTNE